MRILCNYTPCGPHYVRTGWGNVFRAVGHDFRFWQPDQKPAFDVFREVEPDIYIGCTYEVDRAVAKCIAARPQMRVILFASAWGPYLRDIDLSKYPLVVAGEQEKGVIEKLKRETGRPDFVFIHAHDQWLEGTMSGWGEIGVPYYGILNAADTFSYLGGTPKDELRCDVGYVGGYWKFKARNLDRYILPLCHKSSGLSVKIFGNQPWPVAQYLGGCRDHYVRDLFVSATVCPNVSEPHSTDYGWDFVERPYKVLAAGGFCVSDFVEEGRSLFSEEELLMCRSPAEFQSTVSHFVAHPEDRIPYMKNGRKEVLRSHTYWDRVADFFGYLGMEAEQLNVMKTKKEVLGGEV